MLVLFSLLAAIGFAQCDIDDNLNDSQTRRQCKKLEGCKWTGGFEQNGRKVPGTCSASTTCGSLSANQCKKRNNCYINWTAQGRPCQAYSKEDDVSCAQLSGKKNMKKCKDRAECIPGSGDRQNKACLDVPDNLQDRLCSEFNDKPNKYMCQRMDKCNWDKKNKLCELKKKPDAKACGSISDETECNGNLNGCSWDRDRARCTQLQCGQLTDRAKCNSSSRGCTWFAGFHADDFDVLKNKEDQKNEGKDTLGAREGTCKDGVDACNDIKVELHCRLSAQKHNVANCYWNKEAEQVNGNRCTSIRPCSDFTSQGANNCRAATNMLGGRCVWQKSGKTERCMEFACDDAQVNDKNKCNNVGCWWHRNKDKRDPQKKGFCGIYDLEKGRRL